MDEFFSIKMMEKNYKPNDIEKKWYSFWEKEGYFTPKINPKKKPFCVIVPPPNANGSLHIGHALFVTIQDIMGRYHRMLGEPTLLLPGADHAGILTQVVFERELAKKGKTRFDLGREEFYRECYEFTQKNKEKMYDQMKRLGFSCDWTREKFTLEPSLVKVASQTFVNLKNDNLAYRAERMINWCPRCATALSDLEVEYKEEEGTLWYIRYPLVEKAEGVSYITVATTRPETMLGDMAVAVHPDDKRYKKFVGKHIKLPLVGREIEIISDSVVDPKFGTGAVKVTPAHDPVDFEMGVKHNKIDLNAVVIGFDDKMTNSAFEFAGLHKKEAREKIVEKLTQSGFIEKEVPYKHRVGHCERCKTVVEPLISLQWFIKMKPLAEKAIDAVRTKKTKIIPKRFEKIYFNWLSNIRDWCVSRQLWWGPQLPVWYCGINGLNSLQKTQNPELFNKHKNNTGCGEVVASVEMPQIKCPKCGKNAWIQDPDTFDTWFLSGQWPYTTLGFSQGEEKDFKYFYPTSVMETGYEILFFWVARMMMLGIYRTGEVPFKNVFLHGLVRDAFGQKMSKSKGNVVDPLDVVEKYGADALRMALIAGTAPGNDSKIYEEKILGFRNFANKIWNIGRYIDMNVNFFKEHNVEVLVKIPKDKLNQDDLDILEKKKKLIEEITKQINNYRLGNAASIIYEFIWHELADKYIETSKQRLRDNDQTVLAVLIDVYGCCLSLLHPFMPYITEEIYQQLPGDRQPLITTAWAA